MRQGYEAAVELRRSKTLVPACVRNAGCRVCVAEDGGRDRLASGCEGDAGRARGIISDRESRACPGRAVNAVKHARPSLQENGRVRWSRYLDSIDRCACVRLGAKGECEC